MFQGSIVALVTPMKNSGELDESRLKALIEMHLEAGTKGLVVNGTTGEAATLTTAELGRVIEIAIQTTAGRIPVIAGTGRNSTQETIKLTQAAMDLGVDACLVVTPYYNKPTQEGLYLHYKAVAEAVAIPIILYNVPGRTACDLLPETIVRLSAISNIIGIKEATGDLSRAKKIMELCKDAITLYSGDDASSLAFMLQGGKGVISVTANVAPALMNQMCEAALAPNLKLAGEVNTKLMPLHKMLFVESNPIPTKWALTEMGLIEGGIRLPLTPLSQNSQTVVKEAMIAAGVI